MLELTKNEKRILKGSRINEFGDAADGEQPWVFSVISASGLAPQVARGAISSLVKKGLVSIGDAEEKGRANDMYFVLKDLGIAVCRACGIDEKGYCTELTDEWEAPDVNQEYLEFITKLSAEGAARANEDWNRLSKQLGLSSDADAEFAAENDKLDRGLDRYLAEAQQNYAEEHQGQVWGGRQ